MSIPDTFDLSVAWSDEDGAYVATCTQYPSLSYIAWHRAEAYAGILRLVADVIADAIDSE